MQIELSVSAMDIDGAGRKYKYRLSCGDIPLEQVEAHAKSMLAILDAQADTSSDQGPDDGDGWKNSGSKPTT